MTMNCCTPSEFSPMKHSRYESAVAVNALLWVVAIIGIIALTTTAFTIGNSEALGMAAGGGAAALILSLYVIRDRRKKFEITINGTKTTVCASDAISSVRIKFARPAPKALFKGNTPLIDDDSVGDYDMNPETILTAKGMQIRNEPGLDVKHPDESR
jgi:hypothetical protein